jgi:hypothetical protein
MVVGQGACEALKGDGSTVWRIANAGHCTLKVMASGPLENLGSGTGALGGLGEVVRESMTGMTLHWAQSAC